MPTSQTSFQVSNIGKRKNIMAINRKQLQNEERRLDGLLSSNINRREISTVRARMEDVSEELQRRFDIDSYSGE